MQRLAAGEAHVGGRVLALSLLLTSIIEQHERAILERIDRVHERVRGVLRVSGVAALADEVPARLALPGHELAVELVLGEAWPDVRVHGLLDWNDAPTRAFALRAHQRAH